MLDEVRQRLIQGEELKTEPISETSLMELSYFHSIIATTMDAIITVDAASKIVLFNLAAERLFGWTAVEMVGQPLARLLPERFRSIHHQHIQSLGQMGACGGESPILMYGLRANGVEMPLEATISQIEVEGRWLLYGHYS